MVDVSHDGDYGRPLNYCAEQRTTTFEHCNFVPMKSIKQKLLNGQLCDNFDPNLLFPPFNDNALQVILQAGNPDLDLIESLIDMKVNINNHNRLGRQPLHDAIGLGVNVVHILLQNGAEVDGMKHGDWTALMIAAHKGLLEEVQLLLKYQASTEIRNSTGFTAFHLACQRDFNDKVCLFLADYSDIATRANNQRSALFTAAKHGNVATVRLMLLKLTNIVTMEHGVSLIDNVMEGPIKVRQEMLNVIIHH